MLDKILIIDFGSQYTQLIARRIREQNVFCQIQPFQQPIHLTKEVKGVILSGGPSSVYAKDAPLINLEPLIGITPVLGICYGAQLLSFRLGGTVENSPTREYGRASIHGVAPSPLLAGVHDNSSVWMSHGDTITALPENFELAASTESIETAAFQDLGRKIFALQFHPEVTHTEGGEQILRNFLFQVCEASPDWTPRAFIAQTIAELKEKTGGDGVVMGLSGGVDSMVAAELIHRAIGKNLHCIFVDNGILRKNEFNDVLERCKTTGLNVRGVDAGKRFLDELKGITDPEKKRKTIGRVFVEVFQEEARRIKGVKFLGQGTIYPDVIESVSVKGPAATIKSHHNVGGLPESLHLKVLEPLRMLFKDEVRNVGRDLGLSIDFLSRHPFPGPGLAIRILSDVTPEKVKLLQEVDDIFIGELRKQGLYDSVWQAFAVLLPVSAVGVMGDERTYENVVALRAVGSRDGMTADWSKLPWDFLGRVSNMIINQVKGVNRVVYDISSKPPATIEWE